MYLEIVSWTNRVVSGLVDLRVAILLGEGKMERLEWIQVYILELIQHYTF